MDLLSFSVSQPAV